MKTKHTLMEALAKQKADLVSKFSKKRVEGIIVSTGGDSKTGRIDTIRVREILEEERTKYTPVGDFTIPRKYGDDYILQLPKEIKGIDPYRMQIGDRIEFPIN
ncbi:MAG: hypothetical protein U9Q06_00065 [Nanoarchaeota archaeon]|nr:hypothetical protein [Nanoarchaeota archaeon]